jgi:hypothetical protein
MRPLDKPMGWRSRSEQSGLPEGFKNECQDIVEELATAQAKDGNSDCLRAGDVAALTTVRSFSPQKGKKKGKMVTHRLAI